MTHCVIKLGGCNGSGKSTVGAALRELVDAAEPTPRGSYVRKGVWQGVPVVVIGNYNGMDGVSGKELRYSLVARHAKPGNIVFFEGLITGKTYGALGALSEQPRQSGRWLWAFMDTPFDVCVQRVLQRRAERGNANPFDAERTMRQTYNIMVRLEGAVRSGEWGGKANPVMSLRHAQKPATLAAQLLRRAKEIMDGYAA